MIVSTSDEPYATVCGSEIPSYIDTEDNIAHIHFESDGSDNAGGFLLEFTASEDGKLWSDFMQ